MKVSQPTFYNRFYRQWITPAIASLLCLFTLTVTAADTATNTTTDKTAAQAESIIPFFGIVYYDNTKIIYSDFAGHVSKIHVRGGNKIKTKQPLIVVEPLGALHAPVVLTSTIPDAVISRVNVVEGQYVDPTTSLMVVADPSHYVVRLNMTQTDLNRLQPLKDAEVSFSVTSGTPVVKPGKVIAIHEPIQGRIGLYQVEVIIDCSKKCSNRIKSGNIAKVLFKTPSSSN